METKIYPENTPITLLCGTQFWIAVFSGIVLGLAIFDIIMYLIGPDTIFALFVGLLYIIFIISQEELNYMARAKKSIALTENKETRATLEKMIRSQFFMMSLSQTTLFFIFCAITFFILHNSYFLQN